MSDAVRKPAGTGAPPTAAVRRSLRLFLVAGEPSGDALGARLMEAIAESHPDVRFSGVGGPLMEARGLRSLFPLSDVAVMGPLAIAAGLPRLWARVRQTVEAAIAAEPDAVVIIDSPELTHPIARRIRLRRPGVAIIGYVSPSVWAWRSGRAPRMRAYIDHVMALLPFEPAAHERLGGPPCTYVGHPLIERQAEMSAIDPSPLAERLRLSPHRPVLLVLPGSRRSEVGRLMGPIGGAMELLVKRQRLPQVIVATLASMRPLVEHHLARWPLVPHIIEDARDRLAAFKLARAALAASGTVTLELALAGTPMIVVYRVEPLAAPFLRRMIKAPSIVLGNLVLGENVFPEFIQERCTPALLAEAVCELMQEGPARERQLTALAKIPRRLALASGTPSEAAARIVLRYARADASAS
jgi:lipid-A-disaccharide synthase